MIPAWLPVAVPWAGAALLAALPRRPVLAGPAVAAASLAAAVALGVWGGAEAAPRPDALGSALLLAGAVSALLAVLVEAGGATAGAGQEQDDRFVAAGFPLLQGAQALALLAADAAVVWIGLAVGVGAGVVLVARSGGGRGRRRAFAAAWRMLLLCGAGLALALLGVALVSQGGRAAAAAGAPGLSGLGFVLLLLGYGALAGLAPMHVWMPRAVAVSAPPVAAVVAGLLPPAALHAVIRAAAAVGPASGGLPPPAALLAAVGLATALVAASAAWRRGRRAGAAPGELPGWSGAGLAGLAAVGFGLGGAAGSLAGVLLLIGSPFCVGAAVLGVGAGGPVAALGRVSLAGMPPFAPFAALVLLFSAVAALPPATALPLGAALLLAVAAQLGAAAAGRGRHGGGGESAARRAGRRAPGLLVAGPPWLLLGLALALGAALPEPVAAVLAEAAARLGR